MIHILRFVWWSGVGALSPPFLSHYQHGTEQPQQQIAYNLSHLIIKLSYFALYLRLMPDRQKRLVVYAGAVFVMLVGITYTILSVFMCTPIERGWDKSVPGTCVDGPGFLLSNAALNMSADVLVFLMPIPALWGLQCERTSSPKLFRAVSPWLEHHQGYDG